MIINLIYPAFTLNNNLWHHFLDANPDAPPVAPPAVQDLPPNVEGSTQPKDGSPTKDDLSVREKPPGSTQLEDKLPPIDVREKPQKLVPTMKIDSIMNSLRKIVGSGKYADELMGKILLNLIDVGGQPGFLEMLPFLSKGPGMFLVFFPLDKDLDEQYEVSYERDQDRITPYTAKYTIRETLSQILSAVSHHVTIKPDQAARLKKFANLKPVVSLVGTYQDKLEVDAKTDLVLENLDDYSIIDQNLLKEAVRFSLMVHSGDVNMTSLTSELLINLEGTIDEHLARVTFRDELDTLLPDHTCELEARIELLQKHVPQEYSSVDRKHLKAAINLFLKLKECKKSFQELFTAVGELIREDSFSDEVHEKLEEMLQAKNEAICTITSNFEEFISHPGDLQFFPVDNYNGTDSDIDPIREHLQIIFDSFFKDAELRIRPSQLLFGVILRKEYDIVSLKECIEIGRALKMNEEEVKFTIWYLHECVGALMNYSEIKDKWFEEHIISSPNVIFNSISVLIVESLLAIHKKDHKCRFTKGEVKNWSEKGQFSLETVKRCHSDENKQKVKEGHLIPVEKLLMLLEHVNLLAPVYVEPGAKPVFLMPAILQCASKEELLQLTIEDQNTPTPIKIAFESGSVPIGVFCASISSLVSRGSKGILGMKWSLKDSAVKRNMVSFQVDSAKHDVTLVAHADSYEIRVIRKEDSMSLYELCSYVLSTVLYVMSEITPSERFQPIMAFDCHCIEHQENGGLCKLDGLDPSFRCEHSRVKLSPSQECWFTKVCLYTYFIVY